MRRSAIACLVGSALLGVALLAQPREAGGQPRTVSAHEGPQSWWRRRGRIVEVYEPEEVARYRTPPPGAVTSVDLHRLAVRPRALGLVDPSEWPGEPEAPGEVDEARFSQALARVCPKERTTDEAKPIARAALREGARFGVDPFLLAALAQQQGGCRVDHRDSWGLGATRIHPSLYRDDFDGAVYRYPRPDGTGRFVAARLPLPEATFDDAALLDVDRNLYFAAAFLSAWDAQCPGIDERHASAPHRHAVSHFVFGDRVRGTGPEAAIFTVRRRLLELYTGRSVGPGGMMSPLGGAPRLAISGPGEPREDGARLHRGVDFASQRGEPVFAMADGVVVAAGADRGPGPLDPVAPMAAWRLSRLGPRGLAVEVRHESGLRSLYAHLEAYKVRVGERVEAGTLLGYVGRSGMHASPAHLHLGIFRGEVALDPLDLLGAQVLSPGLSWQWWSTAYPRLTRLGLPIPYARPEGVRASALENHGLRPEDRRRRSDRWQRDAAEASRRGSAGRPHRRPGRSTRERR